VTFKIGAQEHSVHVLVTKAIHEMILGIDFLIDADVDWKFSQKRIKIGDEWIKLHTRKNCDNVQKSLTCGLLTRWKLRKEFATVNRSDRSDSAVYRPDQRSDPPSDYQPTSSCKDSSSFRPQSTSGRCSSGLWLSGILFLSLLLFLCTVCGSVECSAVLYGDFGCDNKFPFLTNFVTFESHENADAVSWHPRNRNFTLLLCEQCGPLLEPIEENGGAELKVVIGWIEGQGSVATSSRVVYSGLMDGMEQTPFQLQEMANDLIKHVYSMQGLPKVWVLNPGGEFGVTKNDWH